MFYKEWLDLTLKVEFYSIHSTLFDCELSVKNITIDETVYWTDFIQ